MYSWLIHVNVWQKPLQYCKKNKKKGRGTRDQTASILWITEKAGEFQKNIYFCLIAYSKVFDCMDHNKLWKILKEIRVTAISPISWEACIQVKKQQVEQDMQQWTGSKLGKKYVKAIYCHPASLTYMLSTSGEMLGWMNHKLESRWLVEILTISDTLMTPFLWLKAKRN